ncbi:MAG: tRNA (adenosine(37)-N6)-threonylcarbamoyltransferase complex ATPase subunit type 1 TsaE [Desulfovibrio sp.]|jgi:tRNA threonylcarbamoyladenosine biosynthesis protein TsaE|nr:tRNA (adenosine(37)-N6)-threonylcarbamoyltransferase complex ATPase subunit type 1 TsaE [Desulfovibrio sp.]
MPTLTAPLDFPLASLQDTARLGRLLAAAAILRNPGALLLSGPLGAGKTTLARFLVEALPGGLDAEISSPSFTTANIYCTSPLTHHFDLYRLAHGLAALPEAALEESFDDAGVLTIVEWPERLAPAQFPPEGVVCSLRREGGHGEASLTGFGTLGRLFLELLPGL